MWKIVLNGETVLLFDLISMFIKFCNSNKADFANWASDKFSRDSVFILFC